MIIALSICPGLFRHDRAISALHAAERHLVGPLGMRTLAPDDPAYRPCYDNSNDSDDKSIAKGWNYHQGPEWCWPFGCYLKAWLAATELSEQQEVERLVMKRLQPLMMHLRASDYSGLAELTNKDGAFCKDSCATQAWSAATILEILLVLKTDKKRSI